MPALPGAFAVVEDRKAVPRAGQGRPTGEASYFAVVREATECPRRPRACTADRLVLGYTKSSMDFVRFKAVSTVSVAGALHAAGSPRRRAMTVFARG
jgi:hypothetical protein